MNSGALHATCQGAEAGWGCMVFPSSALGWCICRSGWLFLSTCFSSLRLDIALALAVYNMRAEWPGRSSLLPKRCPWAARRDESQ